MFLVELEIMLIRLNVVAQLFLDCERSYNAHPHQANTIAAVTMIVWLLQGIVECAWSR
jgi:hypothetical protein